MVAGLRAEVLESAAPCDAALIWLHGLGASGDDFVPLMPELGLPPSVRCIMPHAPQRPVTLNQGAMMPSWYDLGEDGGGGHWLSRRDLESSAAQITELLREQGRRGVASGRMVLAGFSQGAALAAQVALGFGRALGALLMLSGFLPAAGDLRRSDANAALPCLVQHGRMDDMVPPHHAQRSAAQLRAWGHPCQLQLYDSGHELAAGQLPQLSRFLQGCFG